MYKVINGDEVSFRDAARFISKLNKQKRHHIGFCGTDPDEIETSIKEDVTSLVAAISDDQIIGLVGLDIDDQTAEIWGPFLEREWENGIIISMWDELMKDTQADVKSFIIFSDVNNKIAKEFAETIDFEKRADQYILRFSADCLGELPQNNLKPLQTKDVDTFITMHNQVFPDTYYNGQEIVEKINDHHKVFLSRNDMGIAGYVYAEVNPAFGEGSFEFIAVDPAYRGNGYGRFLLAGALNWLFSFEKITEIKLTVAADNKGALGLYQSVGFIVEHTLHYFVKKL